MAYTRKGKGKKGKYARRKNKKYYKITQSPSNAMGPLSNKLRTNFIYAQEFSINPTAVGLPDTFVFSLNGLFDPNITAAGNQPRGFDQIIGVLYDHYVVIGVKATVWFTNSDTTLTQMVALSVRDTPTASINPADIMEYRYIKTAMVGNDTGGNNTKTLVMKVNPNKFLGRSKPLSDAQLKGSVSGNPTEQAYLHVTAVPTNPGSDPTAIRCWIRLEYDTMCIEPKNPSQS